MHLLGRLDAPDPFLGECNELRGRHLRAGQSVDAPALAAFVKERIGSVKTPKQIEVWNDLPRSRVGKVLKPDIRARLLGNPQG